MSRPAAVLVTLALALLTAGYGGRLAVPQVGDRMARRIGQVATAVGPPPHSTDVEVAVERMPRRADDPPPVEAPRGRRVTARAPSPARDPATVGPAAASSATAGLEIPAERLALLTEKQLRGLRGVDVVDADGRAVGARIAGVGVLGVGLDDGDIVTSIDGSVTRDVSTALAAAVHAYASGRDTARATVSRGGRTVPVVVHIPRAPSRVKGSGDRDG